MNSVPTSKICSKCRVDKPLSEYRKNKSKKDGLQSKCKDCVSEYYQANRERYREQHRAWCSANRDKAQEYQREYYQANRERKLEYRHTNRERKQEYDRGYYQANRDRVQERKREYNKANPHIDVAASSRRRARKLALPDCFTTEDMRKCLIYFSDTCAYCGNQFTDLFGNVSLHWEHFLPLSSPDCPGTVPENMLCTCSDCNLSKGTKLPAEWLKQRFGTRKAKQIMTRIQDYFSRV